MFDIAIVACIHHYIMNYGLEKDAGDAQ